MGDRANRGPAKEVVDVGLPVLCSQCWQASAYIREKLWFSYLTPRRYDKTG